MNIARTTITITIALLIGIVSLMTSVCIGQILFAYYLLSQGALEHLFGSVLVVGNSLNLIVIFLALLTKARREKTSAER